MPIRAKSSLTEVRPQVMETIAYVAGPGSVKTLDEARKDVNRKLDAERRGKDRL